MFGVSCAGLDPGPNAIEDRAYHHNVFEASLIQEPHDGQDKRNVGKKVAHGEPVDGQGSEVVEAHEDVADDAVLQPHGGVAHGKSAEDEQHHPSPLKQLGFHKREELSSVYDRSLKVTALTHRLCVVLTNCSYLSFVDLPWRC